jgi:hypothetical protein
MQGCNLIERCLTRATGRKLSKGINRYFMPVNSQQRRGYSQPRLELRVGRKSGLAEQESAVVANTQTKVGPGHSIIRGPLAALLLIRLFGKSP